jgi:hypothetical protein
MTPVARSPSSIPPEVAEEIATRLAAIEVEHEVAIPLAVESGSRAWGFPSPDSDFDCRFIYVRPQAHYLSLWPKRDVIELPIEGKLDINGWDLAKALKLLLKGNAVVIEWLTSPITYRADPAFREAFLNLARRVANRRLIGRHYLHLGERQRRTYFADGEPIQQKKLFYVLRPAAALRWLRLHPSEPVAPMHFPTLMQECDPPAEIAAFSADLIERKARTRELGAIPPLPALLEFIECEFGAAKLAFERRPAEPRTEARKAAEAFLQKIVHRLDGLTRA